MNHHITLRQIRSFILAAEYLSFSRAAASIHISQSAFSQVIRDLELEVGLRLFNRTTRKVTLTAAGEAMYVKLKLGMDLIDKACNEAQAIERVEIGNINVGTLPSMASGIVMRAFGQMRRTSPSVIVNVTEGFNGELMEMLARRQLDLSICTQNESNTSFSFEHLLDDETLVVLPDDDPRAHLRSVEWSLLEGETVIVTMPNTGMRENVEQGLSRNSVGGIKRIELPSLAAALALVRAGFGVAFMPRIALGDVDLEGLKALPLQAPIWRTIGIYRHKEAILSPAFSRFMELLRADAGETMQRRRL
jgi:LysR family transcriptional regulator, carnitine catabolism transcriptional activator